MTSKRDGKTLAGITQSRLKELLEYKPDTGEFFWKQQVGSRGAIGKINSTPCKVWGYIFIRVDKKLYRAHRLAFLYMTGEWPIGEVDHINIVRHDNRWCNLRDTTKSSNMLNRVLPKGYNATGFLGVYKRGNKFGARCTIKHKNIDLGVYTTPEEASSRYLEFKSLYLELQSV